MGSYSQNVFDETVHITEENNRIITFSDYYAHTNPLFTKLKLLKLCEIYSYFMCICIYKYINSQLPSNIFDAFFTLTTIIHDKRQGIIVTLGLLFITPKLHPFVFVFKGQKYGIQYHKIYMYKTANCLYIISITRI